MKLKGRAKKHYKDFLAILFAALAFVLSLTNNILGIPTGFGMVVDLSAVPIFLALLLISYKHAVKSLVLFAIALTFFSPSGVIGAIMKFTATLPLLITPYLLEKKNIFHVAIFSILLIIAFALLANIYVIDGFLTSISLIILLGLTTFFVKEEKFNFSKKETLGFVLGIIIRGVVMVITNIYFAAPLFFKMSSEEAIGFLDSLEFPLLGKIGVFGIIFLWNAIQSLVDVGIAYIVLRMIKK